MLIVRPPEIMKANAGTMERVSFTADPNLLVLMNQDIISSYSSFIIGPDLGCGLPCFKVTLISCQLPH
jgi:hypothetical protein